MSRPTYVICNLRRNNQLLLSGPNHGTWGTYGRVHIYVTFIILSCTFTCISPFYGVDYLYNGDRKCVRSEGQHNNRTIREDSQMRRRTSARSIGQNLRKWYDIAEAKHKAVGESWYQTAHVFCLRLAETSGIPHRVICGVTSALSPNCSWEDNMVAAENLVTAHTDGVALATIPLPTYPKQAAKARRLLQWKDRWGRWPDSADIVRTLGKKALKTRAFYWNMFRPESSAVTVDRHMCRIAGYSLADTSSGGPHPALYKAIAEGIRRLAERLEMRPHVVQAILWVTYKDFADAWAGRYPRRAAWARQDAKRRRPEVPF